MEHPASGERESRSACGPMKMQYLSKLPKKIPTGKVLVHNHVRPTRRLGSRGFRAWLSSPDETRLEICDCGWASELGRYFRMRSHAGRKPDNAVLSGIRPKRETWTDIRNRIIYDSAEWPLVGLRMLIGDGSQLPDNYLSARAAANAETARQKRYVLLEKIDALWNKLRAQFERAVLDGDAEWFKRQLQALSSKQSQEKIRFNAKVVHLLEMAMWGTHANQGDNREDLTLTPAGKFTDAMASDIYDALAKQELPNGQLLVEGCRFENKERVMEAIHNMAKPLLQFELRKQPRRKRRNP